MLGWAGPGCENYRENFREEFRENYRENFSENFRENFREAGAQDLRKTCKWALVPCRFCYKNQ